MWILKSSSISVAVLIAITGGLTSSRNNSKLIGSFCSALPQPSPSLSTGPFLKKTRPVQLNGNSVITQNNPPADPNMYGRYGLKAKNPTGPLSKSVVAMLASAGALSLMKQHQGFKIFKWTFDWKTPIGALVTSATIYIIIYSVVFFFIPLFDGLRGVDRSHVDLNGGSILKQPWIYRILGVKAPHPWVGLTIAVAIAAKVLFTLSEWQVTVDVLNPKTPAGKILLAAIGILAFTWTLILLPINIPDPEIYLSEDDPSPVRRVLRYTVVPFFPILKVVARALLYVYYLFLLLSSRTALDKVGTFRMDVSSKDTVGKHLGFALAERIMNSGDQTLSRMIVLFENQVTDYKQWLLREPIRQDEVLVPSDEQVWSMCSKTVLAYNIMNEIDGDKLLAPSETCLDMTPMQFYMTLPNFHYDVARVYLRATKTDKEGIACQGIATRFVMNDGAVIQKGDPLWDIAKLHFISTANLFFPAMQHNWVHFHFVDCCTAMAHSIIPRGSFLHDIMQPFILSNVFTNGNGLGGLVVNDHPKFLFSNVDINPSDNDYFVNSIAHRSLAFYSGKSDYVLSDDVLLERIGFGFPPKFKKNDKVPYTVCLQKSYEAFRVFARKVVDVLSEDSEAMEMFQHWCNEVVRRTSDTILAANVDHVDILATMMWQVSLLHSLDHNGYFYRMAPMNGFSGAMCDYKAHNARRNMYTADKVRTYREFIMVAGKYFPGKPDDSLAGVRNKYMRLSRDQCPRLDEIVGAFEVLEGKLNENLSMHINEPPQGNHPGIDLDISKIGSAIIT